MRLFVLIALFFALYFECSSKASDQFADLVATKSIWQSFDWSNPSNTQVWTAKGWDKADDDSDEQLLYATRHVELSRVNLSANLGKYPYGKKTVEEMELRGKKISFEECQSVKDWGVRNFGKPTVVVDIAYKIEPSPPWKIHEHFERSIEWNLGRTRARLSCMGMKTKEVDEALGPPSFSFLFREKSALKALEPLTGLECEYTSIANNVPSTPGVDFYIVQGNDARLLNGKMVPFTDQVNVDKKAIYVRGRSGGMGEACEVSIDRATGAYSFWVKRSTGSVMRTGKCKKWDWRSAQKGLTEK